MKGMENMAKETVSVAACLDRYEGKKAVLLLGDDEKSVIFPAKYLPKGLDEGDWLNITIEYDAAATEAAEDEAASLLAELRRDDD